MPDHIFSTQGVTTMPLCIVSLSTMNHPKVTFGVIIMLIMYIHYRLYFFQNKMFTLQIVYTLPKIYSSPHRLVWNIWFMHFVIHTITVVVLKQDINTVDVVHATKIHLPPHRLVGIIWTYWFCPHTRRCVSVHSVICAVPWSRVCVGLRGVLIVWQIIFKRRICRHIKLLKNTYITNKWYAKKNDRRILWTVFIPPIYKHNCYLDNWYLCIAVCTIRVDVKSPSIFFKIFNSNKLPIVSTQYIGFIQSLGVSLVER